MPDKYVTDLTRSLRDYADRGDSAQEALTRASVGWTGKNKLPFKFDVFKQSNGSNGTWSGNTLTIDGLSFTFSVTSEGYISDVDIDGTYTGGNANASITIVENSKEIADNVIMTGCPSGGTSNTYELIYCVGNDSGDSYVKSANDKGEGVLIPQGYYNRETQHVKIWFKAVKNVAFNHAHLRPMLHDPSIKDSTFEPYHESVDKCKFDRAEQRVLGAWNVWDDNIPMSPNAGGTPTKTSDGYDIQCTTSNNSGGYFYKAILRNRYTQYGMIRVTFEYKSDIACAGRIGIYPKRVEGVMPTTWTKYSEVFDAATIEHITFYNTNTTKTPVISCRNMMISLTTDSDDTYVSPVKTNKELMDKISYTAAPTIIEDTTYFSENYLTLTRKGDVGVFHGYATTKASTVAQGGVIATISNVSLVDVGEIAFIRRDKVIPLRVRKNGEIINPGTVLTFDANTWDIIGTVLFD